MSDAEEIVVRPAGAGDRDEVLSWRNDPDTRAMARTPDEVRPDAYVAFWSRVLGDPELKVLIGEAAGRPFGAVFFERIDGEWECSVNIDPARRGRKLAQPLLGGAIRAAFPGEPPELRAEIKAANAVSRHIFEDAGFRQADRRDDTLIYQRPGAPA